MNMEIFMTVAGGIVLGLMVFGFGWCIGQDGAEDRLRDAKEDYQKTLLDAGLGEWFLDENDGWERKFRIKPDVIRKETKA